MKIFLEDILNTKISLDKTRKIIKIISFRVINKNMSILNQKGQN